MTMASPRLLRRMRRFAAGLALACVAGSPAPALAQAYPAKPIELVVHTSAGGGGDVFARTVADILAKDKLLPQQLIISNKAGGGGAIAFNYVASKRADPYVMVAVPSTIVLTVPVRSGLDIGFDKLTMLGALGRDPAVLTVRSDAPYATLSEFIEAAKREPGSIVIGFGSYGGGSHYLAYQIEKATGVRFKTVAMKGAQAVLSVLGGHVHATTENLSEVMAHVEAKKMRVLGIPTEKRLEAAPAIPTMREQGLAIRSGTIRGFGAPAAIPKEAAGTLEAALYKVQQSAAWKAHASRTLMDSSWMSGAEFTRYLAENRPEVEQFIKDAGLAGKP
jgi:putative tricarboxylic transport membrane protein